MSKLLSTFQAAFEAREPDNKNIEYEVTKQSGLEKVTAVLRARDSEAYTKLAKKLDRVDKLSTEINKLKKEIKSETKEYVADLFDAEDACRTRVIQTVSVIMILSKDPKPTETYKYAAIVDELEKSLTPELINVLEALKMKFKSTVQKEPSLSWQGVMPESVVTEAMPQFIQSLVASFKDFLVVVRAWGRRYDLRLEAIRQQLEMPS